MANEKQLLIEALKKSHDVRFTPGVYEHSIYGKAALLLEKSEEVVRCKDCKHSIWVEGNERWKCVESAEYDEEIGEWFGFYEYHNGEFYCAYGERKDNGT